jgi:hypothetical protein
MKMLNWISEAFDKMKEGDLDAVRKLIHFEDHVEVILGIGNEDGLQPHEAAEEFVRAVNAENSPR